jgi:guanosine-3',5'-bis(diphosphate) 3'-pyrophosphohydrolase
MAPLQTFSAAAGWPALRSRLPAGTHQQMDEAVSFATRWHGDQTRPAGEPYVEHLLEVVTVLVDGLGVTSVDVLLAAVLHDVVEDTDCSLDEVNSQFGPHVASLVDWLTKTDSRAAYLERLKSAPADALLIKLADRLSNVQRLDTHPRPEKRRTYYAETVRSIVPLAQSHPWFRKWYSQWQNKFQGLAVADGGGDGVDAVGE